jgi:hypothetical protein
MTLKLMRVVNKMPGSVNSSLPWLIHEMQVMVWKKKHCSWYNDIIQHTKALMTHNSITFNHAFQNNTENACPFCKDFELNHFMRPGQNLNCMFYPQTNWKIFKVDGENVLWYIKTTLNKIYYCARVTMSDTRSWWV